MTNLAQVNFFYRLFGFKFHGRRRIYILTIPRCDTIKCVCFLRETLED